MMKGEKRLVLPFGGKILPLIFGAVFTAVILHKLYLPVQAQAFKRVKEGQLAPVFSINTPEGVKLSTKDYSGKVLVVCFWKFGQKSEAELVALQQIYNKYKDKSLEVLAVYIPEGEEKVASKEIDAINKLFVDKGLQYTVLLDEGLKVFSEYGVITMPSLTIIDKDGKVASIYSGFPKFGGDKKITELVESALGIAKKVVKKKKKGYQPKGKAGFHYKFGQRFYNLGFMKKAENKLKESLKEDQDYPDAHLLLAKVYVAQKKTDEAMLEYNLAIAVDEKNVELHVEYGTFAVENEMYDEAFAEFEMVKILKPGSGAGDFGLGQIYLAQGKNEEALKSFQAAINAYTGKSEKKKASIFDLRKKSKATKGNPDLGPAYYGLAQTQLKLDKKDEAIVSFQEAIKSYQKAIEKIKKDVSTEKEED